jgi:hypothetical protein
MPEGRVEAMPEPPADLDEIRALLAHIHNQRLIGAIATEHKRARKLIRCHAIGFRP